jgi:hypothetical protein
VSRVEHGHTVPAVETLEKFARALEVPMYQLFYDGEELPNLPKRKSGDDIVWGSDGNDARMLSMFCRLFGRMIQDDLGLVLYMAQKMAKRKTVWASDAMTDLGSNWLKQYGIPVEVKKLFLTARKPSDIYNFCGIDPHALKWWTMRHRRDNQISVVLKANKPAIKQMVDTGCQQQAILTV